MQRGLMLEDLTQDFRICLRSLLRAPMLTLTIVATVGLGIGATTAIFSAVNAALLRPLPYADPDRLVRIYTDSPPFRFRFSVADYLALEAQQTQFEQIAAYTDRAMTFSDGEVAERLRGRVVSWTYFAAARHPARARARLHARPMAGRAARRRSSSATASGSSASADARTSSDNRSGSMAPTTRSPACSRNGVGPLEQRQEFFVAAQWSTPPRRAPSSSRRSHGFDRESSAAAATDELRAINRRIFPHLAAPRIRTTRRRGA